MEPFTTNDGIIVNDKWIDQVIEAIKEQRQMDEFRARSHEPGFYNQLIDDLKKKVKRPNEITDSKQ